ncbi:hypothetical protein JCM11491_006793 [Sporobolomyces phaffii]
MVLTRSDSWFVPSTPLDDKALHLDRDQRRVRHLESISVRNLTLDPTLDSLSTSLSLPARPRRSSSAGTLLSRAQKINEEGEPPDPDESNPTTAVPSPSHPNLVPSTLTSTSNSFPFPFPTRTEDVSSDRSTFRARSTSRASVTSTGTITSTSTVRQAPRLPAAAASSSSSSSAPAAPTRRVPLSTEFAKREARRRTEALRRKLVDSFISIELVPTNDDSVDLPAHPSTSASAAASSSSWTAADKVVRTGRSRSATTTSFGLDGGGGGGGGPPSSARPLKRSDSASSGLVALRRPPARRRTVSSNFVPTTVVSSSSVDPPNRARPRDITTPFFVSNPAIEQVNPRFFIDPANFIVPPTPTPTPRLRDDQDSSSPPPTRLPDDVEIAAWPGLRESRVRVRVFARKRLEERLRDVRDQERRTRHGKDREGTGNRKSDDVDEETGWRVLTEWDVDLSSLVSLGRDPTLFPSLPPNTLLFTLRTPSCPFSFSPAPPASSSPRAPSSSFTTTTTASAAGASQNDLEYFTAPLDILLAQQHRLESASSSSHRRRRTTTTTTAEWSSVASVQKPLSYSDDEDNLHARGASDDSCTSDDDDDDDDDDACGSNDDAAGGGNASDPGARSSSSSTTGGRRRPRRRGRIGRERERGRRRNESIVLRERIRVAEDRRRRVELVERSRRETRMVELAPLAVVERLWVGERALDRVRAEHRAVADRLRRASGGGGGARELDELTRDRAEREDRVGDLEGVRDAVEDDVGHLERKLDARRVALALRKDRLARARQVDDRNRARVAELGRALDRTERTNAETRAAIVARRTDLVTLLSHLFPIEPVVRRADSGNDPDPPPVLLFSIASLALPNSTYPRAFPDDLVSSALGHAAHLTLALAQYLSVPLCYPILWRASRSVVKDEISMMKGPRAFPLYGKGVDQYRFDYGVFLLNKNIEQLMYSQNLTVLDLRNTLPNLKTLVLSLSHGEWSREFAKASLRPEGVFAQEERPEGRTLEDAGDDPTAAVAGDGDGDEEERRATTRGGGDNDDEGDSSGSTSFEPATTPTGRSRSSSMASAASTIRQQPQPAVIDHDAKNADAAEMAVGADSGGGGGGGLGGKVKVVVVEGAKRKRKESGGGTAGVGAGGGGGGSWFANSVWSAVAGRGGGGGGGRDHSRRASVDVEVNAE